LLADELPASMALVMPWALGLLVPRGVASASSSSVPFQRVRAVVLVATVGRSKPNVRQTKAAVRRPDSFYS